VLEEMCFMVTMEKCEIIEEEKFKKEDEKDKGFSTKKKMKRIKQMKEEK
jgi:hypothetical protein